MHHALYVVVLLACLVLGFATGCTYAKPRGPSVNTDLRPRQAEATEIVWNQVFGHTEKKPPPIIWVEREDLDCNRGKSFFSPLAKNEERCVNGLFWPFATMVAWPANANYSTTAFVHELLHAHFWVMDKVIDVKHASPEWYSANGLYMRAIAALQERGL